MYICNKDNGRKISVNPISVNKMKKKKSRDVKRANIFNLKVNFLSLSLSFHAFDVNSLINTIIGLKLIPKFLFNFFSFQKCPRVS